MTRYRRQHKGAALVSVLVLGIVGMVFLYGLASVITSGVRATSANKWAEGLRNCAEIGMDYAVDSFNTSDPCPLDPQVNGSSKVTILPASELTAAQANGIIPNGGVPNAVVTITVTRLNEDSDWANVQNSSVFSVSHSAIYSPQLDPTKSFAKSWSSPAESNMQLTSGGGFRIIESKASNGIVTRTIRVILKARFEPRPDGRGSDGTKTRTYFEQPSFGNVGINFTGPPSLKPGDLPISVTGIGTDDNTRQTWYQQNGSEPFKSYFLNVASNKTATIGNNVLLSGNVVVTSSNSSAGTQDVQPIGSGAAIEGRVLANGNHDAITSDFTNVEARADASGGTYNPGMTRFGENRTPVDVANPAQYQLAPVVTPSAATPLSDLSTYVGGTPPTTAGDPPATFQTESLSTDGIASGKQFSLNNDAPVRIFVDQGGNSDKAVSIDTSKFTTSNSSATNPVSSNLQIWYAGNRNVEINLNGNPFNGVIYAPNALVKIRGNGDFKGAMVGKQLDVALDSGSVTIDADLSKVKASPGGVGAPANTTYQSTAGNGAVFVQGWQPVTWQEYGAAMP